jgi:protein-L-isoaspartate(D-aspartate) O-methyltransferase
MARALALDKTIRQAGIGMTSARTRDRLIQGLRHAGLRNETVLELLRELPRHWFVDEALSSRAYENTPLPIGHGQTISQPYIVGRMTEALLAHGPLDTVLEIGTGSGYQTAVLASLVKRVYSVERIESLLTQARQRMRALQLRNVRFKHADGCLGFPEYAPYSGILVTAAPEGVPRALVNQLAEGCCMILPIGNRDQQALVKVVRTGKSYTHELLERVSFVPLVGGPLT